MRYFAVNGELLAAEEAALHVSDLGFARGYALFDFFLVKRGVPLFVEDYLDRFFRSAELLGIEPPMPRDTLKTHLFELLAANRAAESSLKLFLTGGYSSDGFTPTQPNLVVTQQPPPHYDPSAFRDGVQLLSHPYVRDIPEVKTTNYAKVLSLRPQLQRAGAMDVLWHGGGLITESSRSNVFVVDHDHVIYTPDKNVLKGITRKHILALARESFEVRIEDVPLAALQDAKEVFMTSSTKGVMPITKIDGNPVGEGVPGEVSRALAARFQAHVDAYLASQAEPVSG